MISKETIFGNLFDSTKINPVRLLIFAKDAVVNMTANNATHDYDAEIDILNTIIAQLETEISVLDSAVNLRSGETDELDAVVALFVKTMSTQEGVIADKFGGRDTIGFKEFYPALLKEYHGANRTTLPTLTERVSKAAVKYTTTIGAPLATKLQSFFVDYKATRSIQSNLTGTIGMTRGSRSVANLKLEIALTGTVHFIAGKFPGDVDTCSKFFKFNLLFTVGHHKHITHNGTLIISEIKEITNQLFTDNWSIIVRNKGVNATIEIWLATTADETVAIKSITIQPGNASVLKPSDLGVLTNPFLLIKNLSAENDAIYEVVIIG